MNVFIQPGALMFDSVWNDSCSLYKMDKTFTAVISMQIDAPVAAVWEGLTNPAMISKYLHGTNVETDWKVGSPILFSGNWNGKEYVDKGVIMEIQNEKLLRYTWLSSMSGLEDKEENYSVISFVIRPEKEGTHLKLTQENIATEEGKEQSQKNWEAVLEEFRRIVSEKSEVGSR